MTEPKKLRANHSMEFQLAMVEKYLQPGVSNDDPFSGHLFIFRGRHGDMIKMLWADEDGLCLFVKCLERGHFVWPAIGDGKIHLTPAQLAMLLESLNWKHPQRAHQLNLRV